MKSNLRRIAITLGVAASLISVSALAAEPLCEGKGNPEAKAKRFQKADTNGDGFLTKAEVGDKRWERLAKADTNKDAKISKAEFDAKRHGRSHKKS
jgi:hypothetical protein